nr:hypothetical protein [Acidithiobacillus ferrianus]
MKNHVPLSDCSNDHNAAARRSDPDSAPCTDPSPPESVLEILPAELVKIGFSLENARHDLASGHYSAAEATLARLVIQLRHLLGHLSRP